ncbi:hypothetical protein EF910_31975 [Streptomyces sp. WAC07149]|uniref:hypothetical protein n=1 Tax=Streptomyces sp. WAC07149 TaxID=2487425 RepID=UPI000F7A0078|nr:hypothetical protein [Streptomyces sp. WAC07149]RST00356.1 hypothetical protein EF910_31975 [Streptomyces sp. WAC07149]
MFVVAAVLLTAGCNGTADAEPKPEKTIKRTVVEGDVTTYLEDDKASLRKAITNWNNMQPSAQDAICAMTPKERGESFGNYVKAKGDYSKDMTEARHRHGIDHHGRLPVVRPFTRTCPAWRDPLRRPGCLHEGMGRQKKNKPLKQRRPNRPNRLGQPPEGGGEHGASAFFPYEEGGFTRLGLIDARVHGPGVQLTISPTETEDGTLAGPWTDLLRVGREGTDGTADRLAHLLATSTSGAVADMGKEGVLFYAVVAGVGTLAKVDVDADGEPLGIRSQIRQPAAGWETFGTFLRDEVIPLADPTAPMPTKVMDSHPCSACGRPVFETMPTAVMPGLKGGRPAWVCPTCADGTLLDMCRAVQAEGMPPVQPGLIELLEEIEQAVYA